MNRTKRYLLMQPISSLVNENLDSKYLKEIWDNRVIVNNVLNEKLFT